MHLGLTCKAPSHLPKRRLTMALSAIRQRVRLVWFGRSYASAGPFEHEACLVCVYMYDWNGKKACTYVTICEEHNRYMRERKQTPGHPCTARGLLETCHLRFAVSEHFLLCSSEAHIHILPASPVVAQYVMLPLADFAEPRSAQTDKLPVVALI